MSFFLEELQVARFPFRKIILNSDRLQHALFQEYLRTEKVPNFRLFLRKNFSDKEINELREGKSGLPSYESGSVPSDLTSGSTFKDDQFQKFYQKFLELRISGGLDKKYYSHSIEATQTVKALEDIHEEISAAKNQGEEFLSVLAKSINRKIENLKEPELQTAVLQKISDPREVFWRSLKEDKSIKEREILFKTFFEPGRRIELQRKGKKPEDTTWFKVGLTFATGKAQALLEKYKLGKGQFVKGHFTKITEELGFKKTDKVYFSQTFNNTTKDNKNIYSQSEKILQIFKYCQTHDLEVVEDFRRHLPKNYNLK